MPYTQPVYPMQYQPNLYQNPPPNYQYAYQPNVPKQKNDIVYIIKKNSAQNQPREKSLIN